MEVLSIRLLIIKSNKSVHKIMVLMSKTRLMKAHSQYGSRQTELQIKLRAAVQALLKNNRGNQINSFKIFKEGNDQYHKTGYCHNDPKFSDR